jgi:hypothetical protein
MSGSPILFEESQGFGPWVYVLLGALLVLLVGLFSVRMQTTVTSDAVRIRYGFLGTTRVPLREIARADAVVYRPIRDFGGWGKRGFGSRRVLNARGNQGVLITRRDGATLMVGSMEPRRLLAALAQAGVETQDKLPSPVREF